MEECWCGSVRVAALQCYSLLQPLENCCKLCCRKHHVASLAGQLQRSELVICWLFSATSCGRVGFERQRQHAALLSLLLPFISCLILKAFLLTYPIPKLSRTSFQPLNTKVLNPTPKHDIRVTRNAADSGCGMPCSGPVFSRTPHLSSPCPGCCWGLT